MSDRRSDVRLGSPLVRRREVGSTMDEVLALARSGAPEGATVVAEYQLAGRGRAGRVWMVPPGSALLMSVLLHPGRTAPELPPLSLLCALAVADTLEDLYGIDARIKWPNDVQVGGRKVCGILLRSHMLLGSTLPIVVLGIGLNANIPDSLLPENATSVAVEVGHDIDRDELRERLLRHLETLYARFLAREISAEWSRLTGLLAYQGVPVTLQDGDREMAGTIAGLDPSGALRLTLPSGETATVISGDLTRGPRPVG